MSTTPFIVANSQLSHTHTYLQQLEQRGKTILQALEADLKNGEPSLQAAGTKIKEEVERIFAHVGEAKTKVVDLLKGIENFGRNEGVLADAKAKDPEAGA